MKSVIRNYNRLPHRYHGYRPIDVVNNLAVRILQTKLNERNAEMGNSEKFRKPYKFKLGQTVRTTRLRKIFDKAYGGVFTDEIFVVMDRFRRKPHMDINLYRLKDLSDRPIENSIYYENELQRIELPDKPAIKHVLKHHRRGKQEVSLTDFPADFSIWM